MKAVPFMSSLSRNSGFTARWLGVPAAMLFMTATSQAEVPKAIAHQGRIAVTGVNFEGNGLFKFLLFADADTDHASGNETPVWSNASTTPAAMTEPASAVTVPVSKGLYGTWLGDTTIANMAALPASVEPPAGTRLYLRVWFGDGIAPFLELAPDQAIAAVPFALSAASVTQGGVTADALADGAVTAAKIAPGAFTDAVIEDGSITAEKLASGAVTQLGTLGQPGSIAPGPFLEARDFDQTGLDYPVAIAVSGNFAYVIDTFTDLLQIFDVSNPDAIVAKDSEQLGMHTPRALAVSGIFAYVLGSGGLKIFDVSDPENIIPRGSLTTGLGVSISLAVSGDFAYLVDELSIRLRIVDISNPDEIVARGTIRGRLTEPKSVAVSGNFAYVTNRIGSSLIIFDVSDPDNIVEKDFEGSFSSFSSQSIVVSGNLAYTIDSFNLRIYDVSDPDNIVSKDIYSVKGGDSSALAVSSNIAYVVNKSTRRLQIFDVSNPDDIVAKDFIQTGLNSPVSVAVSGNHVYVVDQGTARLQIFSTGNGLISPGGMSIFEDMRVAGSATISGMVSADEFVYTAPKPFALSIPGNAMLAQSAPDDYFRSTVGFIRPSGVSNSFSGVAPVQLPQGANIVGMDIFYYDNSAGNSFTNLTTRLRRLNMFSTSGGPEENIIALDVPSPISPDSTTLVGAFSNIPEAPRNVVDNTNFQYFVTVGATVTAPDSSLRFYGFRIRYTLSTLSP